MEKYQSGIVETWACSLFHRILSAVECLHCLSVVHGELQVPSVAPLVQSCAAFQLWRP